MLNNSYSLPMSNKVEEIKMKPTANDIVRFMKYKWDSLNIGNVAATYLHAMAADYETRRRIVGVSQILKGCILF